MKTGTKRSERTWNGSAAQKKSGGRVRVVPETEIAQYIADVRSRWFDLGDHEKDRMLAAIDALVSLDEIRDARKGSAVNCSEGKEHEDASK